MDTHEVLWYRGGEPKAHEILIVGEFDVVVSRCLGVDHWHLPHRDHHFLSHPADRQRTNQADAEIPRCATQCPVCLGHHMAGLV